LLIIMLLDWLLFYRKSTNEVVTISQLRS